MECAKLSIWLVGWKDEGEEEEGEEDAKHSDEMTE